MIEAPSNEKHKLLLSISYEAGLRVSEVVNLKVKDTKEDKDRITILPDSIREKLNKIISVKETNEYVFSSERGGKLTARMLKRYSQMHLKRQVSKRMLSFITSDTALLLTCSRKRVHFNQSFTFIDPTGLERRLCLYRGILC